MPFSSSPPPPPPTHPPPEISSPNQTRAKNKHKDEITEQTVSDEDHEIQSHVQRMSIKPMESTQSPVRETHRHNKASTKITARKMTQYMRWLNCLVSWKVELTIDNIRRELQSGVTKISKL